MGFKFRYQALLSYREHLKEKAEIEFGSMQRELQKARQVMGSYEERFRKARISLEQGLMSSMSSEEMATYSDYLKGMKGRIQAQRQEIARRERIVHEKRKAMIERTREYRIMEKLMEKDQTKWIQHQSTAERKEVEEISVTRHGREYR